ncbi:carboxynorspermidine decarboxylase [Prevotella sp. S7 MS 2]|uniref:carboxynorspermidine decarboxylase n=1 Tax=Prevotella sp. S7 MS 2 TaxID=1287488 RepID=UPI000512E6A8|nr:carboxynorspermidine decarboxylase [Prevotella sp. S7 MS 2]KGI60191.1 carboxynorspermidine decarboxylase [Prevotella sp. S7 MS 2]
MTVDLTTFAGIHRPIYILEGSKLRRNLELIQHVAKAADVEIILAFKAYALWKTFPIFKEYIGATTASSLNEAKLAFYEFGSKAHTFSPAYTDYEIDEIAKYSSHLTFNSLSQYARYAQRVKAGNPKISIGLRVNPEYSEVGTDLYNPCALGTRFGVTADKLPVTFPNDVEGFHCHCHCESGADVFQRTLQHIEEKFSPWFSQLKWINFGGGHLMTRSDYDVDLLIRVLEGFHDRYPHLQVILEPGSAFAWQTGPLVSQVVDVVEDHGIQTAILNVSFTCHMPDCLEMPYQPAVRNAKTLPMEAANGASLDAYIYRLGGNSCLSGDFMGSWQFDHQLQIGENIIFEDMIHYTTVKTNTFNGISHPALGIADDSGNLTILREYDYEDYKSRMD